MDVISNPIIWGPLVALVLIGMVVTMLMRLYVKVPPNIVAVFSGRGEVKVVRGGGRFRVPGLERVDFMELDPFDIVIDLKNAISKEGVPINVDAVGLVRFGSDDTKLQTAIQRFLTVDRMQLHGQLNQILAGNLRGIVAKMTVEELNADREGLARGVIEEAGAALSVIGMEVDALTIQTINDTQGYLEALGARRTAEVKRDANIGTAEAERETTVRVASAQQEAQIAQAAADAAIAQAQRDRDIKLAGYTAEVQAEQAKAAQAGPLADAEARKAVGVAEENAAAARVEARTRVEELRVTEQARKLEADTVAPAEAGRQAAIASAEGERQARILAAQAEGEAVRLTGQAHADARKLAAAATQAEGEAEAASLLAKLMAEAEGQTNMATALNLFTPEAMRLQLAPTMLKALVDATHEAAAPLSNIDRVSIIGGGSGSSSGGLFGGLVDNTPKIMENIFQILEDHGFDITQLFGASNTPAPTPQVTAEVKQSEVPLPGADDAEQV